MPVLSIPRESLPLADFQAFQTLVTLAHRAGGESSLRAVIEPHGPVELVERTSALSERSFRFRDIGFTARRTDNGITIPISLSWMYSAVNGSPLGTGYRAVMDLMAQADTVRFWYGGMSDNRMELCFPSGVLVLDGVHMRFVNGELRAARGLDEFDIVGSREKVTVLKDKTTQKLHWAYVPSDRMMPSGAAIVTGLLGNMIISPAFDATSLLVCAVTYDTDRTSYYWHPSKNAIRKLNNTCTIQAGANKTVTIAGANGEFVSSTQYWLAVSGQIVEELVLHGSGVPVDHKLVNEQRRRRILSWTGESMVASTAMHIYGASNTSSFALAHPSKPHLMLQGDMRENHAALTLKKMSVDSWFNDNELAWRSDAMYRIVGNSPTLPLATAAVDGGTCYAAQKSNGTYAVLQRMEPLPREPTIDFAMYPYGNDGRVVTFDGSGWFIDTTQRRAMARGWVEGQSDLRTGVAFNPEDQEKLIVAVAAASDHYVGVTQSQHEGWAWMPEWGTPPGVRARHDRYPDRTEYVPPCESHRIKTCACCGATVANISHSHIRLHRSGGDLMDDVAICRNCVEEHLYGDYRGFFQCSDCNEWFHSSAQSERHDVCESCFENNYDECERCGTWTHTVQLSEGVCRSCRTNTGRLLEYSYRPKLVFHRVAQEPMVFGCEIELEGEEGSTSNDVAFAASRVLDYPGCKNFLIAKRDGSLSCGAEFVTQPFSWEWFLGNKQRFVDIFENMRARGFTAKRSCGLHVHVSRQPHSHLEEFRALQLVYAHPEKWRAMSGRVVDQYCKFDGPHTGFKERVRVARERSRFGDRYVALNPTDRQTLEWRIWSGTGQFDKFESALATVVASHAFVRSGATGVKPSFEKFREFCKNHGQFGQRTAPRLALAV